MGDFVRTRSFYSKTVVCEAKRVERKEFKLFFVYIKLYSFADFELKQNNVLKITITMYNYYFRLIYKLTYGISKTYGYNS